MGHGVMSTGTTASTGTAGGSSARSWTDWGYEDVARWGAGATGAHVARHRLHEHPALSLDAVADLLDRVPREIVHPYTMGTDPTRTDEWRRGAPTDLPGSELLDLVARGRLWLNVVGVGAVDPEMAALTRALYDEIAELAPGFAPTSVKTTLLVSSPTAQVYYHADNQPNALWHLHGRKRVFVYPLGRRFVTPEHLEEVVAGTSDEQLPYRPELDTHAWTGELEPGQVAWWPQNSPHRVVNLDGLNVSLSTEHRTAASTRREQVVASNHFARHRLGRREPSQAERGVLTEGKIALARVARRAARPAAGTTGPRPTFVVDPSAPDGVRALP